MGPTEPLQEAADEETDLQGIATWEPRSLFDRFLAGYIWTVMRVAVVLLGLVIFAGVILLLLAQVVLNPSSALFVVLFPISVIPAFAVAAYVWYTDITNEPIWLLLATFFLGVVLSSFPFLINTTFGIVVQEYFSIPVVGFFLQAAFFFLIVGPFEETAKLGAVYVFAYHRDDFDTVIDGAVYGAVAGLGFATIENISYIIQTLAGTDSLFGLAITAGVITTVRGLAGPGHVIWTAIAGYYLGLAKFNEEYGLALVTKGLLIAAVIHATYNTISTGVSDLANAFLPGILALGVVFGFVVVFQVLFAAYLFVRLRRYRKTYRKLSADGGRHEERSPDERTPGEPGRTERTPANSSSGQSRGDPARSTGADGDPQAGTGTDAGTDPDADPGVGNDPDGYELEDGEEEAGLGTGDETGSGSESEE